MHQSTQKSIRDALEKRRVRYTGSYSDNFIQSTEQINNRPGAPMFSLDMTAPSHSSLIAAPANLTAVMWYSQWEWKLTDIDDVLLPSVWELFCGTLYHESILTLALPLVWHSLCIAFDHSSITSCQLPFMAWVLRIQIWCPNSLVISNDRGARSSTFIYCMNMMEYFCCYFTRDFFVVQEWWE